MQETNQTVSPDGQWRWNGTEWVPNTAAAAPLKPKKKRLGLKITGGILGGLIALAMVNAAIGGDSTGTESTNTVAEAPADEAKTDESVAEEEPAEDSTPGIGDKVRDGKFEFTVTKVKTDVPSVGGEWGEKAQGAFTLVTVTVENIGDEAQMFDASAMKGTDSKGREVESDGIASTYASDDDVFLEEINPGNSIEAVIAYDLAKGVTLTSVELHDSMFSDGVEVALEK